MRAKKTKGDPDEGNRDSKEEAPFAKPVNSTTEDREKHIKELEKRIEDQAATIGTLRSDRTFMHGAYEHWPPIYIGEWPNRLIGLMSTCKNWKYEFGFYSTRGKYEHLSKEQKKQVIANMEGYVIQDDFDKIVPRLPPNIRCNILAIFAGIIVVKEILSLFFTNPFWYLEWPDSQSSNDGEGSGVETPFGAQLNHLYQTFLNSELLPKCVVFCPVHKAYRIFFLSGRTACSSLTSPNNTPFQCIQHFLEPQSRLWTQESDPPRGQDQASRCG